MSTFSKETIETAHVKDPADSRPTAPAQPLAGQLHSDAVSLEVPLKVHGTRTIEASRGAAAQTEPFEEQTSSMIVFPHGGVVRMATPLAIGQMLVLTNQKTRQDAICRVVKVRTYSNSASYVEVEFTHRQPGFWGVYFEGDAPASTDATSADPLAPAAPVPSAASATKPRSGSPAAQPSAGFDSNFASFGSQEVVQPAASSTGMSTPGLSKTSRPASVTKSTEPPMAPAVLADPLSGSASPSASLRDARAKLATPSAPVAPLKSSPLPAAVHEQMAAASPSSDAIVHQAAGETFGARLGSDSLTEVGDSAGNKNLLLIAACAVALFVVAGGGYFFLSHKSGDKPAVVAQPASQPAPSAAAASAPPLPASTSKLTMPSSNVTVTASTPKSNTVPEARETPAAPVSKTTKEPPVVKESYSSTEPASQPAAAPASAPAAAAEKTSVPSVFGTLNAHPVAPARSVTAAAPNVDAGMASAPAPNALAGITSSAGSALPEPVVNSNLPLPVGGRVKEPQLITRVLPTYPPLARQAHTEGDVVVQVIVDKSGNVTEVKAISGPTVLRAAAIDAVHRWKYEAPTLDGQPITVQMLVTLRFQL